MSLHKYTLKRVQAARVYAAKGVRREAANVFDASSGYADHVSDSDKRGYARDYIAGAEAIERRELDHNLTVWQRMHYFLTGDCVPLLSPRDKE